LVAHGDVHLDRLWQAANDRLHAVENELGVAVEETQVGHLAEVQRAPCGFGVNAARLRELGYVLPRGAHQIEPEELAALEERAQLLRTRVAQRPHTPTVASGQDSPGSCARRR